MSWVPLKYHYITGTHCWYCDRQIGSLSHPTKVLKGTKEHILPRWQGGITNTTNCVRACDECNHLKGHMDGKEFAQFLSLLPIPKGPKSRKRLKLMKNRAWKAYNKTSKLHLKLKNKKYYI